ncbi:MAG: hypothetical protein CMF49_03595 [Legionellales bacterium]|nr:hypothetical protein [Legionellales bacterium]
MRYKTHNEVYGSDERSRQSTTHPKLHLYRQIPVNFKHWLLSMQVLMNIGKVSAWKKRRQLKPT